MQDDGCVSKNVKYDNLCNEQFSVHVAYNDEFPFEIVNDSMVEYTVLHGTCVGVHSFIPLNYEIIDMFIKNHNIMVKWINCNFTWGLSDDETGK